RGPSVSVAAELRVNHDGTTKTTKITKSTKKNLRGLCVLCGSHAGSELLFLGMAFERERDEAIEQLGILEAACGPHLRVHADGREAGNRVHFVQEQHAAVAGQQEVDARHAGAVD